MQLSSKSRKLTVKLNLSCAVRLLLFWLPFMASQRVRLNYPALTPKPSLVAKTNRWIQAAIVIQLTLLAALSRITFILPEVVFTTASLRWSPILFPTPANSCRRPRTPLQLPLYLIPIKSSNNILSTSITYFHCICNLRKV